ncbi:MAG: response regulator transcription factor [Acutalibacteraceae bacterium]|nr:response regulator transcription factor [Acutalibacteraceae bacterium]
MDRNFNVLIADDEKEIISVLRLFLEKENINVYEAYDGEMAYMIMQRFDIDLAIIDIMMPRMNGYDLLKKLRVDYEIPVMIISAKVQLDDKVIGLELGADDYITKPFEPLEVIARVKAHLRRQSKVLSENKTEENVITHKDLTLDLNRCQLKVGDRVIDLTKIELDLMDMFICSPGRVFTKEQIFQRGWDDSYVVDDNTIRVTISRLRDKIGSDRIKTIRGLGYRMAA